MTSTSTPKPLGCAQCANNEALAFPITMAFQPIVNTTSRRIFSQEALVRGVNQEPAGKIFEQVNADNLYRFDQTCRVKAIELASRLKIDSFVNINFMPNAVYQPELCIRTTLAAAEEYGFPPERIIFEITESEKVADLAHLKKIVQYYQSLGFKIATDDFGAGHSGLNLLAEIQSDIIKLDMALVRNIHQDRVRRAIVRGIVQVCNDLGIDVIAEGVETAEELVTLQDISIELFQGYYFSRPTFESLAANIRFE